MTVDDVLESLPKLNIYEGPRLVKRPRKDFTCCVCNTLFEKGTMPKFSIKHYGFDGDWPEAHICAVCMDKPNVVEAINIHRNKNYDEYY